MISRSAKRGNSLFLAAAFAASLAALRPVAADMPVFCTNCSTIFQRLQDAFQRTQQLSTAINQLQIEINTYQRC